MIPKSEGMPAGSLRRGLEERHVLFTALMWLGAVIVLEALSHVGGVILENWSASIEMKRKSQIYSEQKALVLGQLRTDTNDTFDPDLGWTYRPNYRGKLYSNNSDGLRGTREYSRVRLPNVLRIAAFGDSFVYGSEVGDRDTWTYQLETLLPNVEVLNFGVGGYGTDQALLRYRKHGRAYKPDIVFIGFMGVDLPRNVNIYRRFLSTSELVHFKPRFVLSMSGDLVLVPSPIRSKEDYWRYYKSPELIREMGELDHFYKPSVYENPLYDYSATVRLFCQAVEVVMRRVDTRKRLFRGRVFNDESEAFEITQKVLKQFAADVRSDGAIPIVLMFPGYDDITGDEGRIEPSYQPLMRTLRDANILVVDLGEALTGPGNKVEYYMPSGHLAPRANGMVAEYLADYLSKRALLERHEKNDGEASGSPRKLVRKVSECYSWIRP